MDFRGLTLIFSAIISACSAEAWCSNYKYCFDDEYCCNDNTECCSDLSYKAIIGIAVGCFMFVIIVSAVVSCCKKHKVHPWQTFQAQQRTSNVIVISAGQNQQQYGQQRYGQPSNGQPSTLQPYGQPSYGQKPYGHPPPFAPKAYGLQSNNRANQPRKYMAYPLPQAAY